MNIQRLGVNVKAEQQMLKTLRAKAIDRQLQAKAAKAKARAAKLDYKKLRAEAKKAKELLRQAEEQVERQCRILAKAEKDLAKALRRASGAEKAGKSVPAAPASVCQTVQQLPDVASAPAITADGKGTERPSPRPRKASVPFALSSDSPG
jgi:septal ring factor EnvC (AmiA/AmiB activator)